MGDFLRLRGWLGCGAVSGLMGMRAWLGYGAVSGFLGRWTVRRRSSEVESADAADRGVPRRTPAAGRRRGRTLAAAAALRGRRGPRGVPVTGGGRVSGLPGRVLRGSGCPTGAWGFAYLFKSNLLVAKRLSCRCPSQSEISSGGCGRCWRRGSAGVQVPGQPWPGVRWHWRAEMRVFLSLGDFRAFFQVEKLWERSGGCSQGWCEQI